MHMRYLLDTNICVYIRRHRPDGVRRRFHRQAAGSASISVVTWGELLLGAAKSSSPAVSEQNLRLFAELIPVLPLSAEVAECYARIRCEPERSGEPIGANDLWIAAHALAERLILVSNNEREFKRIKGLKVENWAA